MKRLIEDEDGIYMVDEECLMRKEEMEREKEMRWQKENQNRDYRGTDRKQKHKK